MRETEDRFRRVELKNGKLLVDGRQFSLPYEVGQVRKFNRWWDRDVEDKLVTDIQVSLNNRGARAATRAGLNVEIMSSELESDATGDELEKVLASSNGYHFSAEMILDRAIQYVGQLEKRSGNSGWGKGYLMGRFLERLASARSISETRKQQYGRSILQERLQI